jgi:hypothetical protein
MPDDPVRGARAVTRYRRIAAVVLVVALAGAALAAVQGRWLSLAALTVLAVAQVVALRSVH